MTLIAGRAGSNYASYQEVVNVPMPKATRSYSPISNRDLIDLVEHKAQEITGFQVSNRHFVLGAKGNQLFGSVSLKTGDSDRDALLGFANSYDKTLSVRVVSGASIMVCSNMCISGSEFTTSRKHTSGVALEIEGIVTQAVEAATRNYRQVSEKLDSWKSKEMKWDRGAETLGRAFFDGIMTSRQMAIAMGDWRGAKEGRPRHKEFKDPTMYSLYNAVTEGLKNGPASGVADRYRDAHKWMEALAA